MAEYKALAQNTYKFITETILHNNGNISAPCEGNYGRIKRITTNDNKETIEYVPLVPVSTEKASTGFARSASASGTSVSGTVPLSSIPKYCRCGSMHYYCETDDKIYHGVKNAYFADAYFANPATEIPSRKYPSCYIKVVMYNCATNSIEVRSYQMSACSYGQHTPKQFTDGSTSYSFLYLSSLI